MINPQSAVLRQLLLNEGLVSNPDVTGSTSWPCFLASMPDGLTIPAEAVCIYDTVGNKDGRLISTGTVLTHYGCQIKVRGHDFLSAWSKMDAIRDYIDSVVKVSATYNGHDYVVANVSRTHPPFTLGLEPSQPKRRHNLVVNVLMSVTED